MPEFIRWEPMTRQEGWHGFLGEVRVFAVIPWISEKERWPWQLQNLRPEFISQEPVQAARTSDEAKLLAEMGVALFLTRARLVPASDEQLDAAIPSYRNGEAEQDRTRWLCETGWHEDSEHSVDAPPVPLTIEEANRRLTVAKMIVAEVEAAEAFRSCVGLYGTITAGIDPVADVKAYLEEFSGSSAIGRRSIP